ncbi:MAG: cytochrome C peroxidase [Deltaproteobacteria bacterium]|nr:cytochrome C peroxidase [Deltaproteobacteria bacterium]
MKSAWLSIVLVAGCVDYMTPDPRDTLASLPSDVPTPADNPTTPEKVALGRALFWDPILSGDRDVACASCHHPDFAYGDGLAVSVGVGGRGIGPVRATNLDAPRTPRNAQTVLVTAFNGLTLDGAVPAEEAPMFWNHRVASLEQQVFGPIKSDAEMRGTSIPEEQIVDVVVARLAGIPEYAVLFEAAFGAEGVTATTLAKAIAAFERTLVPTDTSFDRYMKGDDEAMSTSAIRGMHGFIFQGCARCHNGPMLSDFKLYELPIPATHGGPEVLGEATGKFRTASLRMISRTAPYGHNGVFENLSEVADFYHNIPVTTPLLEGDVEPPLGGGDDLLAFFEALSDGAFDRTIPDRVPSGLSPGGP